MRGTVTGLADEPPLGVHTGGGPRGRTTEHVPRSLRAWRPADGREMEWNQSDGTGELARKLAYGR